MVIEAVTTLSEEKEDEKSLVLYHSVGSVNAFYAVIV